jgi:hypothetical protein
MSERGSEQDIDSDDNVAATREMDYYGFLMSALSRSFVDCTGKLIGLVKQILALDRNLARTVARRFSLVAFEHQDATCAATASLSTDEWWPLVETDGDEPPSFVSQMFASILYQDWRNDDYVCPLSKRNILAYEPVPSEERESMQFLIIQSLSFPSGLHHVLCKYVFVDSRNCLIDLLVQCMEESPHWILEMALICECCCDLARVYPNQYVRYKLTREEQKQAREWLCTFLDELQKLQQIGE